MARRKKPGVELDPVEKARQKKLRAAQRREDRKAKKGSSSTEDSPRASSRRSATPDYSGSFVRDDFLWLRRVDAVTYANKIVNNHRERPWWMSISHDKNDGNPPVAPFSPCSIGRTADRVYYGFLIREHRDLFFAQHDDARKEVTEVVRRLFPNP